jgi:kanamycin kinase
MSDWPDLAHLGGVPAAGEVSVPPVVAELAGDATPELLWRNQLGGLTYRVDDTYVKWNPLHTGIDLERECSRLEWISARHPAPPVRSCGRDEEAQWLITGALPGGHAVGGMWRARRAEAIIAIADGLRAIHAIAVDDFPARWTAESWVGRTPASLGPRPSVIDPVLVHGDACAPNTLISSSGEWTGNVDFGDLAVGDRWADLAIAAMSLDWNFGEGHQAEFYAAYGIEPDVERIAYYRALWDAES